MIEISLAKCLHTHVVWVVMKVFPEKLDEVSTVVQQFKLCNFFSFVVDKKIQNENFYLLVYGFRYFHIFDYLRYCATDDISFSLQRKAADKNGQTKRKANKVTNAGIADVGLTSGNEFDDSIDNLEQQQRPKRPKRERPTKSVNENIEPAFTAMPVEALQQPEILSPIDRSSGGFSMSGQNLNFHPSSLQLDIIKIHILHFVPLGSLCLHSF